MSGDAASYGLKLHSLNQWEKWLLEASYTYSRSKEWFKDYDENKKNPTLHDIPHSFHCGTSYKVGKDTYISLGGYIKSGTLVNVLDEDFSSSTIIHSRMRKNMNYRLDVSFAGVKDSKNKQFKLLYKFGLYNIAGNPKENEIIDLYSVDTKKHCLPYFTLNLKF